MTKKAKITSKEPPTEETLKARQAAKRKQRAIAYKKKRDAALQFYSIEGNRPYVVSNAAQSSFTSLGSSISQVPIANVNVGMPTYGRTLMDRILKSFTNDEDIHPQQSSWKSNSSIFTSGDDVVLYVGYTTTLRGKLVNYPLERWQDIFFGEVMMPSSSKSSGRWGKESFLKPNQIGNGRRNLSGNPNSYGSSSNPQIGKKSFHKSQQFDNGKRNFSGNPSNYGWSSNQQWGNESFRKPRQLDNGKRNLSEKQSSYGSSSNQPWGNKFFSKARQLDNVKSISGNASGEDRSYNQLRGKIPLPKPHQIDRGVKSLSGNPTSGGYSGNQRRGRISFSKPKQRWQVKQPKRNWLDLPSDVMANIIQRLGVVDILENVQKVCTSWRKICKDPAMWRIISMHKDCVADMFYDFKKLEKMCMHAVDLSEGQLLDIDIQFSCSDELLQYIADRSSKLKRLQIVFEAGLQTIFVSGGDLFWDNISESLKKFPLLEELSLHFIQMSRQCIEAVGSYCPKLKSFKLNRNMIRCWGIDFGEAWYNEEAYAIAQNLPRLRHLELIGNDMTSVGLKAILDSCPCLESLDLRRCRNIQFDGDFRKRCSQQIKLLKFPTDSIESYEFNSEMYSYDRELSYVDCPYGFSDSDLYSDDSDGFGYYDYDDFARYDSFSDYDEMTEGYEDFLDGIFLM